MTLILIVIMMSMMLNMMAMMIMLTWKAGWRHVTSSAKVEAGEGVDVAGYHEVDTDNHDPHDQDGDWRGGGCQQGGKLLKI